MHLFRASIIAVFAVLFGVTAVLAQPAVLRTNTVNGISTYYALSNRGSFMQVRLTALSGGLSGTRYWQFGTGTPAMPSFVNNWQPYTGACSGNSNTQIAAYNQLIAPNTSNPSTTATATLNTGSGGCAGYLPAVSLGRYYTFNISKSPGNNNMAVLETAFNPTAITSTNRSPQQVTTTSGVIIRAALAAVPQTGELFYVRYSTDNFVTSTLIQMECNGQNAFAAIPPGSVTVKYYILSVPAAAPAPTHATADMLTLNLLNNSNSYYSYTPGQAGGSYYREAFNATYEPISTATGATLLTAGSGTMNFSDINGTATSDNGAALIPLPFDFLIGDLQYSAGIHTLNVCTNGYVSLVAGSSNLNKLTTPSELNFMNSSNPINVFAGWWDDLTLGSGEIMYQVFGTSPSRRLVVQFNNVLTYSSVSTSTIQFQMILYESAHWLEIRYGNPVSGVHHSSEGALAGLKWSYQFIQKRIDAISGSSDLGNAMNHSEAFPDFHIRFIPKAPDQSVALAAGVYQVGAGKIFPTLTEAIASLNHRGIAGPVTLTCTDPVYQVANGNLFPLLLGPVSGASETNTVTIKGNGAILESMGSFGGSVLFSGTFSNLPSSNSLPLLGVFGADYLTIQDFTLRQAATIPTSCNKPDYGLLVANLSSTDGARHNTFRDLTIALDRTMIPQSVGIVQQHYLNPTDGASNDANSYLNIQVSNAGAGILLNTNYGYFDSANRIGTVDGGSTRIGGGIPDDIGNGVSDCYGIKLVNQQRSRVEQVEIRNLYASDITKTVIGIDLQNINDSCITAGNLIYNLRHTAATFSSNIVSGMRCSYSGTVLDHLISNNRIYGLTHGYSGVPAANYLIRGIWMNSALNQTCRIIHNSVLIDASGSPDISSACLYVATGANPLIISLVNNILANTTPAQAAPASHAVIRKEMGVNYFGPIQNNNMYYVPDAGSGYLVSIGFNNYATIAAWNAASGMDGASMNENPNFISSTDLHLNGSLMNWAEGSGIYIADVPQDAEAENRNTQAPDIGADEADGCGPKHLMWKGTVSSNWHDPANWCLNTLPDAASTVWIESGTPFQPMISDADVTVKSIQLQGGMLDLLAGRKLTLNVSGSLINNGGQLNMLSSSKVEFAGSGILGGVTAISFKTLICNQSITFTGAIPTISDTLLMRNNGYLVTAPFYASGSVLVYEGMHTFGYLTKEWTAGLVSGQGVPWHVQIGGATTSTVTLDASVASRYCKGTLSIQSGSVLAGGPAAGYSLVVEGSWINNGTYTSTRRVIFSGTAPAQIGGITTTTFVELEVLKGADTTVVLDVNKSMVVSGSVFNINSGLFRVNSGTTVTRSAIAGSVRIEPAGGLHINGGSVIIPTAEIRLLGYLRVSSGTLEHAQFANYRLNYETGSMVHISGGTVKLGTAFSPLVPNSDAVFYTQTGGTVTINGSTLNTTTAVFDLSAAGSVFTTTGGLITLQGISGFTSDFLLNAGTTSVTGGSIITGNSSTLLNQVFRFDCRGNKLYNLTLNNDKNQSLLLVSNLQIDGTFTMSGEVDLNNQWLQLNGFVNRSGLFKGSVNSILSLEGSGAVSGGISFKAGSEYLKYFRLKRINETITLQSKLYLCSGESAVFEGSQLDINYGAELYIGNSTAASLFIEGSLHVFGKFILNQGGALNALGNPPVYETDSYLVFQMNGNYTCGIEWSSDVPNGKGYPFNVQIINNTLLHVEAATHAHLGCAGTLMIGQSLGSGDGVLDLSEMGPYHLHVGGNIQIGGSTASGTLRLSNTIGGDLWVDQIWSRSSNSLVNFGAGKGRSVYFKGTANSSIFSSGGQNFPFLYLEKADVNSKLFLNDPVSVTYELGLISGTLDLATYGKNLILCSDSSNTCRVAPCDSAQVKIMYGSSESGWVFAQQYIPARRAWRLLTVPLKNLGGLTNSITKSWQERAAPYYGLDYSSDANAAISIAADTIAAGYGTLITGGASNSGFDQSANNGSSIKFFNNGQWQTPSGLNTTGVKSQEGWMLFVRGDRKNYGAITSSSKAPTSTTLRPRGQLYIGRKSVSATGLTVVGNPYASSIDFSLVNREGTGWAGAPTYYMWDPLMGGSNGVGAFVALTWNGVDFTRSAPITGTGSSSIDNRYIPSAAAFLVDFGTGGTLQFEESDKVAPVSVDAFQPLPHAVFSLHAIGLGDSLELLDGATVLTSSAFSSNWDVDDVNKPANFTEMLSLGSSQRRICIERRPIYQYHDTIQLMVQQMKARKYQLNFLWDAASMQPEIIPVLIDRFSGARVPMGTTHDFPYRFEVFAGLPRSYDVNRFYVVFQKKPGLAEFSITTEKCQTRIQALLQQRSLVDQIWLEEHEIETGVLRRIEITGIHTDSAVQWLQHRIEGIRMASYQMFIRTVYQDTLRSQVVQQALTGCEPVWLVYPNPAHSSNVHILLKQPESGGYTVRLLDVMGRFIRSFPIRHLGGKAEYGFDFSELRLQPGIYELQVIGLGKQVYYSRLYICK